MIFGTMIPALENDGCAVVMFTLPRCGLQTRAVLCLVSRGFTLQNTRVTAAFCQSFQFGGLLLLHLCTVIIKVPFFCFYTATAVVPLAFCPPALGHRVSASSLATFSDVVMWVLVLVSRWSRLFPHLSLLRASQIMRMLVLWLHAASSQILLDVKAANQLYVGFRGRRWGCAVRESAHPPVGGSVRRTGVHRAQSPAVGVDSHAKRITIHPPSTHYRKQYASRVAGK